MDICAGASAGERARARSFTSKHILNSCLWYAARKRFKRAGARELDANKLNLSGLIYSEKSEQKKKLFEVKYDQVIC